ncbi:MAG: RHS repeat-associated core domain-containing protein [Hyphomicrobium sp.]
MGSRTVVDRPLAVVNAVNTASPVMWRVHVDHLNRPVKMTDAAKAAVWTAVWTPWGAPHSITGTATMDARFPGQWYQLEAGLHYNWHRSYDPSLGRYTQPDPLGFVDGPSVFGYAIANPQAYVDRDGRQAVPLPGPLVFLPPLIAACHEMYKEYSRGGGGGGKDDDDDPCQGLFDADTAACKRVISKAARARCYDSADSRYGACRAGKPLPPLIRH